MSFLRAISNNWVGRNANSVVLFAMPFLAGAGGSLSSILFFGCCLWNLLGLALGRMAWPRNRTASAAALVLLAYFALRSVSVPLSEAPDINHLDSFKLIAFVGFMPIIAALAHAPVANALQIFLRGAACGAICGALQALAQVFLFDMSRAEGMNGNPGPFATMMAISGGLAALLAVWPGSINRFLSIAGAMGGLAAMLLAGSKGLMPVIPLIALVVIRLFAMDRHFRPGLKSVLAATTMLALAVVLALPVLNWRFVQLRDDLTNMGKGQYTRSIGSRLVMWQEGLSAFADKPLFGHGYNLRTQAVNDAIAKRTGVGPGTHLHNGFITDLVGNGLAGLLTHCAVLVVPFLLVRSLSPRRVATVASHASAVVIAVYVFTDIGGLTFGHDILDCWYVFFLSVLAGLRVNNPLSGTG